MKVGFPSKTAQSVAIRRAEHQLFDFPHVLDDPIALGIIGAKAAASLIFGCLTAYLPGSRYMRAFIAARSRYAEDQLARAIACGTSQYVILGAGLDTFAYRNPYAGFRIESIRGRSSRHTSVETASFGVDRHTCSLPVTFVPVDFEHQKLEIELQRAGFRLDEPAFFSWLGVTPYLPNDDGNGDLRPDPVPLPGQRNRVRLRAPASSVV